MGWFGGPAVRIGAVVRLNGHDVTLKPNSFKVQEGDVLVIDLPIEIPLRVREDEVPGVIIHRGIEVVAAKEEA